MSMPVQWTDCRINYLDFCFAGEGAC